MRLFGFQFGSSGEEGNQNVKSFIPPQGSGSTIQVSSTGMATGGSFYLGMDNKAFETIESENALIKKYREIQMIPDVDFAIDEIANDSIVADELEPPVELNLDDVEYSEKIKEKMFDAFDDIIEMLDFKRNGGDIFKRWYIDGRVYFHILIDEKRPRNGIQQLRYVDPRKMKRVRQYKKEQFQDPNNPLIQNSDYVEYYMYSEAGIDNNKTNTGVNAQAGRSVRIQIDSIQYADSGIYDKNGNIVLSHLHKAIRPANNWRNMEDAMLISRIARAPERRAFYIDVGNLPKAAADQYMNQIMQKHRNKIVYDPQTGEIKDSSHILALTEDYWLPRREGSRGTEIQPLPGASNMNQIEDVKMIKDSLYRALNVPMSRFSNEGQSIFGRAPEITREELRFGRFVSKLRQRFSQLFEELLRAQLLLKGVMSQQEFEQIRTHIRFDYLRDNHFVELIESEVMTNRLQLLSTIDQHVGSYFSKEYAYKEVLKMTDEEIEIEKKRIKKEKQQNEVNPNAIAGGEPSMPPGQEDYDQPNFERKAPTQNQNQDREESIVKKTEITKSQTTNDVQIQ